MNPDLKTIYTQLSSDQANLILLVLASQNITAHSHNDHGRFDILVESAMTHAAINAVENYYKENKFFRLKQQIQHLPISSFISVTAFIIMGLLTLIHAFVSHHGLHEAMVLKYGASALYILQGETHRAITALFFHADVQHLLGNLAGMLIFGAPVIRLSGYGTGPFMLLFCGTCGNLLNAWMYQTAHISIGASTSIMAAAGLLCAFQATQKNRGFKPGNLMPIFSGALLMALFSQGENTDVWAHVFGFICGLGSGFIFFPLNRTLLSPKKEPIALFITLSIVISALLSPA